jgi:type II secretion system protein N
VKRLLAAAVFAAVLVVGSWFVVFPQKTLLAFIRNSTAGSGLTVDLSGFKKGYFYDVSAKSVTLKREGRALLDADDLSCRPDFAALLRLKPALRCKGGIAGGTVNAGIGLAGGEGQVTVKIDGARIEKLPFLSLAGIGGSGSISGRMEIEKGTGQILFAVEEAHLLPASFGGIKIPLDAFTDGTGALALEGRTLRVTSFSLEGKGIYARVKGTIAGNRLNLKMELMPQESFIRNNPLFGLLANYKDSPGHYSIPITTAVNF